MSGVLTKPVEPEALFTEVARWTGAAKSPAWTASGQARPGLPPDLAALSGFDTAAGLARMAGNVRLYRRMLAELKAEFTDTAERLRQMLAEERIKDAELLSHNLKGVAGDLGAGELSLAAANLEQALSLSMPPEEPLAALALVLGQTMQALETLLDAPGEAPPPQAAQVPLDQAPDLRQAALALAALEDLTSRNRLDADRHIAPLMTSLAGTAQEAVVRELEQALASFRYPQALRMVRDLRRSVDKAQDHPLPDPPQTAKP